jgi:hypothetical protein
MHENYVLKTCAAVLLALVILMAVPAVSAESASEDPNATVSSTDINLQAASDSGETFVTIDANRGLSVANVTLSVNTSVVEIVSAEEGTDVGSSNPSVNYNILNQTSDSVQFEYTNLGATSDPVSGFELAAVEIEAQTDQGQTPINLSGRVYDADNYNQYNDTDIQQGEATVGTEPPEFVISDLTPEDVTVSKGDSIDITANVTNVGGSEGRAQTELAVNGTVQDSLLTRPLGESETDNIELTLTTSGLDVGDYSYSVTTGDDSASGNLTVEQGDPNVVLKSSSVTVGAEGDTAQSSITMDAENGVGIANVSVSVNTSVAEVVDVSSGADVDASNPSTTFELVKQTAGSATVEYNNIGADDGSVTAFEVATVELEAQTDSGDTTVSVESNSVYDGNSNQYSLIAREQGQFLVGSLFSQPLPGFSNPPTNTGDLSQTLYEDVDGDGDGLDPSQAVLLWSQLVQNPQDFEDLTQEQIDALDWNGDGQLSPADAVQLWSQQVQAGI